MRRRKRIHYVASTGRTACGKSYQVGTKGLRRATAAERVTCSRCLTRIP